MWYDMCGTKLISNWHFHKWLEALSGLENDKPLTEILMGTFHLRNSSRRQKNQLVYTEGTIETCVLYTDEVMLEILSKLRIKWMYEDNRTNLGNYSIKNKI